MVMPQPRYEVRIARSDAEIRAAHRLRYQVFVQELGADGPLVDHAAGLERDHFDAHSSQLILLDRNRAAAEAVVGVYRLIGEPQADAAGGFYSEGEYDLAKLRSSGCRLLELGRSCVHPLYRNGMAMFHLWNGIAEYVAENDIEIMFGVASLHGTDVEALANPLSLLHHEYRAPKNLLVRSRDEYFQRMDLIPRAQINRKQAMLAMPSLIKAYLRLGGCVGEGAYVDHAFNTTDVCMVMETNAMSEIQKTIYSKKVSAEN